MRIDKLAVTAQEALQNSVTIAADAEAAQVEPVHLLKALLDAHEGNLNAIIERIGADTAMLSAEVDRAIEAAPKVSGSRNMPRAGDALADVVDAAV